MPNISPELDKELRDYLGLKKEERAQGNTNAAIKQMLSAFWDALNLHIKEDERQFNEIHTALQSHHVRLTNLETVTSMKPINSSRESINPPVATSTGSFKIKPEEWQQIADHVTKLETENREKEIKIKAVEEANERLANRVKYGLGLATGVIAVIAGIVTGITYLSHHFH